MKKNLSINQNSNVFNSLKLLSIFILMFVPFGCKTLVVDKNKLSAQYPAKLTIVAFGDSITAPRKSVNSVFAERLPYLLAANGINASVINSGIGGSHSGHLADNKIPNIKHGLDRFEEDVLAKNPDVAIIGFGTNDGYIDSKTPDGKSRIPLNKYKENLIYMIKSLKSQGAKVILIAPNPLGKNRPAFQNDRLYEYVKVVRELAKSFNTGLVDNYTAFQNFQQNTNETIDDLMLDSVHPNDRGHEIIAAVMLKEILNLIKL